jgi:hypothetical protein
MWMFVALEVNAIWIKMIKKSSSGDEDFTHEVFD